MHNLFILLVPGGGVEPPRGCPRRILSPLSLVLHSVAKPRIDSYKAFGMNRCVPSFQLHRIAQKCTEIDTEQPLKQPPKNGRNVADFRFVALEILREEPLPGLPPCEGVLKVDG